MNYRTFTIGDSFLKDEIYPVGTEIYRIQQTIKQLKADEKTLLAKINQAKKSLDLPLIDEICLDIFRIYQDWEALKGKVEPLSDVFLDKHFWMAEINEGLKRSSQNYIIAKNKFNNQRYPPLPAIECGLNRGL